MATTTPKPDPGWDMGCGHFDSLNDPNHDCSTWGDDETDV